ncbi:MAG: MFS transporter [Spirochaetia bacterium]
MPKPKRPQSSTASVVFFSVAMFMVGLQIAETGAALERMTASLGLSSSQQGVLVSLRFIGGLVVGLMLWVGHARVHFKRLLSASLAVVLLTGPLLFAPSYGVVVLIAALRGLAMGAIIPLSGMFSAAQTARPSGTVASVVNAALSAGLVILSLFATVLAARLDVGWEIYWAPASVLAVILLLVIPFISFPQSPKPAPGEEYRNPAKHTVWGYSVAALFLVGSEGVLLGLMPAQSTVISESALGGEFLALLLMTGVLVGRVTGTQLFKTVPSGQVIAGSVATLVVAALVWSLVPPAAPVLLFVLGFSTGNLFPGLVSHISETAPEGAGATIASMGWTGGLGGTVIPALTGASLGAGLPVRLVTVFVIVPSLIAYLLVRAIGARRTVNGLSTGR